MSRDPATDRRTSAAFAELLNLLVHVQERLQAAQAVPGLPPQATATLDALQAEIGAALAGDDLVPNRTRPWRRTSGRTGQRRQQVGR